MTGRSTTAGMKIPQALAVVDAWLRLTLFTRPWDMFLRASVTPADWWCFITQRLMTLLTSLVRNFATYERRTCGSLRLVLRGVVRMDERHLHIDVAVVAVHVELDAREFGRRRCPLHAFGEPLDESRLLELDTVPVVGDDVPSGDSDPLQIPDDRVQDLGRRNDVRLADGIQLDSHYVAGLEEHAPCVERGVRTCQLLHAAIEHLVHGAGLVGAREDARGVVHGDYPPRIRPRNARPPGGSRARLLSCRRPDRGRCRGRGQRGG